LNAIIYPEPKGIGLLFNSTFYFKLDYQNSTNLPLNGMSLCRSAVAEPVEAEFGWAEILFRGLFINYIEAGFDMLKWYWKTSFNRLFKGLKFYQEFFDIPSHRR